MPQQDRIVQTQAQRRPPHLLRRKIKALPQLHLRVQKYRDTTSGPQPGKRREIGRGHQVQVPELEEQHPGRLEQTGEDQPDHQGEEPQPTHADT